MLTPDYLEHCADEAIKINAELENFIIKDIARRIVQAGVMTETARHQIKAVQESGYLYNDIIEEIANITNLSTKTVKTIFENAAIETMTFDDNIYELAGLKPTAFRESPAMMQILKTGIQKANNDINNLIMTTAGSAQSKFQEITNMAYRQYTSGAFDYNTAIFNAVEQLSKDGINVMYPSGKLDKIDVAVRRAVLTGVSQTANKLQDKRAEEMDCDLVEVTAHIGARVTKKLDHTNHAWWQGKVYSISGNSDKYPSLKEVTGYGKVDGLGGINCRHNKFPFIEGVSKRAYTDKELEEINNKTVTYNGKEYGEYEALKMQRAKEREIREIKREISGYQGIMLGSTDEKLLEEAKNKFDLSSNKLKSKENELKSFVKQTGLKRNTERERVVGFNKSISQKAIMSNKKAENSTNLQNDDIITTDNIFEKLGIDINEYKPFGKYDPYENNIQEQAANLLKMDGKPKLLNSKEFAEVDGDEIVRILHSYHGKTAQEAYENTVNGSIQYSENTNSSYGRGIYFGSKDYESDLLFEYSHGQDYKILNAKISKEARIIKFKDSQEFEEEVNLICSELPEDLKNVYMNEKSLLYMLQGVDGIKIENKGYYCIYNRGVLIINDK